MILLGVNIDHVATLRQVRGTRYPSPVEAALAAVPGMTRADAAQAYRRSLGAGGLTREVREYAETRIRALE